MVLGTAALLFARLGHYALWDDEAITALTARGVWRTGDTSAVIDDHNVLVYRNGLLLGTRSLADRFTPPLQFYLLAPFVGVFGLLPLTCRLPFALCGLGAAGVGVRWLWRVRPPPVVWWTATGLILSNASLMLFCRQCRYYGLATGLTVIVAYLYVTLDRRRWRVVALGVALALLLASQYIDYAAVIACLIVDYALWGRQRKRMGWREWAVLAVPQAIVGVVCLSIWNPVGHAGPHAAPAGPWVLVKLLLLAWLARDSIASGFFVLPLLILAVFVARPNVAQRTGQWAGRGVVAVAVFFVVVTLCAASPTAAGGAAEIRYLVPVIPIAIAAEAAAVAAFVFTTSRPKWALPAVLAAAALSTLVQPFASAGVPRLDLEPIKFVAELVRPQVEPYTPVADWLFAHAVAGDSVRVEPAWMAYPLMARVPKLTYAWQLDDPPPALPPQLARLPDIDVKGRVAPEFILGFGPWAKEARQDIKTFAARGIVYDPVATLDVYWQDRYRPERPWRDFATRRPGPDERIRIWRRRR